MPESRITVGNVEIMVLTDSASALPLSQTFPDVPAESWTPYRQRYPGAFVGDDSLSVHFDSHLIRSQGRTILVDTGLGSAATNPGGVDAFGGGADGRLVAELQAAGLRPEDIDIVFLTHLHPDHVGWNVSQGRTNPAPTFPRARYIAHQADWDAFKNPEVSGVFPFSFWEETLGPLERLGVLDLLPGEQAITDEITAIHTPGHTPGSMSLSIVSGGERALLMGDVFHGPTQVHETDWVFSFDMEPEVAIQTRRRMIDRAEAEDAIVAVCHYHAFGRIVRAEGRRYWQGI